MANKKTCKMSVVTGQGSLFAVLGLTQLRLPFTKLKRYHFPGLHFFVMKLMA